jgi:acyl carrier protein
MSSSSIGMNETIDVAEVKAVVTKCLAIEARADALDAQTPLTSIPELDSLAVVELVLDLERHFGITVEDEDVTAEVFDTIGTLAAYVDAKTRVH